MRRKFGRSLTGTTRAFVWTVLIGGCGAGKSEDEDQARIRDRGEDDKEKEADQDDSPCRGPAFTLTSEGLGLAVEAARTTTTTDEEHNDRGDIGIGGVDGLAADGLLFDFGFPGDPDPELNDLTAVRGKGEFPGWQWLQAMRNYSPDLGCPLSNCCQKPAYADRCGEWVACSGTVTVTGYNPYLVGSFNGSAIEELGRYTRPCVGKGQPVAGGWSGTFCLLNDIFASP